MRVDPNIRIVVQWLHVLAGVLWIGGGSYTLFVQLPALLAVPPPQRGPVMAQLAPRQMTYLLRVAELTLATGVLQIFATGRAEELTNVFGSRWSGSIVLGIVGALAIYGLIRGVVKPATERLLGIGQRVASGDAAAANEAPALIDRIRTVARAQIAIGFAVIFLMVVARFS
jgi:uncharacterized membrane protein